jgi:hypothetical protein
MEEENIFYMIRNNNKKSANSIICIIQNCIKKKLLVKIIEFIYYCFVSYRLIYAIIIIL